LLKLRYASYTITLDQFVLTGVTTSHCQLSEKMFEDTKWVLRSRKSIGCLIDY
jgi:hypothetical protein